MRRTDKAAFRIDIGLSVPEIKSQIDTRFNLRRIPIDLVAPPDESLEPVSNTRRCKVGHVETVAVTRSDRNDGRVILIARSGEPIEPVVIAEGVAYPEGLALWRDEVLVLEGETGNVLAINGGSVRRLVTVGGGSPAASAAQPPSMIFNDIVVVGDILYATDELKRQIYAVTLN